MGEDVETVLLKAAGGDVAEDRRSIVYLDEIDKLGGSRACGARVLRLVIQHAWPRMIEGAVASIPSSGGYKLVGENHIPFDAPNLLVVRIRAFIGLEEIVARRLGREASFGLIMRARHIPRR